MARKDSTTGTLQHGKPSQHQVPMFQGSEKAIDQRHQVRRKPKGQMWNCKPSSPHKTLTSSSHVHKKPETRDVVRSQTKASLRYKEPKGIVVGVTRSEVGSAQSVAVKTKDYTLENNSSQTKRSGEDDSIQKPSSSEASLKESQEGEEVVHAKSCISAKYIYNAKHNDAAKHNDKPSTSTKRKPSTTTTSSTATEPKYIQSKGI
ncbi:hypothetical protein B9Z55_011582 [Caenorhabditis nigoni]|uniref:Uncharacterized protein n=1 Tax=Caenorhabditis nigoni TaxID=1611254 RepID=A0A2G5TN27_9PELO|nr:hypothetical protein B9Z55_020517 [Caenorhabditis nigoni]PIC40130.1 hypothetical protein B9Z55_011582 [Caenorhabditis nigoni]